MLACPLRVTRPSALPDFADRTWVQLASDASTCLSGLFELFSMLLCPLTGSQSGGVTCHIAGGCLDSVMLSQYETR